MVKRLLAALVLGAVGALFTFVPIGATGESAAEADGRLGVSTLAIGDASLALVSFGFSDPIARFELAVPAGYELDLSRPVGAEIGYVTAGLTDLAGGSSFTFGDATLTVADPSRYASDPAAQACAPGSHEEVWQATFKVIGQSLSFPVFLDRASSPAGSTAFVMRACPIWVVPNGSGVAATSISVVVEDVLRGPSGPGRYTWSALVTPTHPASTMADPAQTFEVRALVPHPHTLTMRAQHDAKAKTAVLSGKLMGGGEPEAGVPISFVAYTGDDDPVFFGPVTTDAQGEFSLRRRVDRSTQFQAGVDTLDRPCTGSSQAPAGCVGESIAAPDSASAVVKVRTARDPKLVSRARDQALAKRLNLRLDDFPAGWEAYESLSVFSCSTFTPKLSDLTVGGEFESPVFVGETSAAASRASVYASEAHARTAFKREARLGAVRCFADEARRDGETVRQVAAVPFPPLGQETRAFRVVLDDNEDVYTLDLVSFRRGRAVVHLLFSSAVQPFPAASELAAKVAARGR